MKSMKSGLACLAAALSFLSLRAADPSFEIAVRGKPAGCTVAVADDASPAVRYAADELCGYVKRLTGVALEINGKAARRIVLRDDIRDLVPDGFRIEAKGDELRIRGQGPRGCLYGVYDLLERFGGVGFYSSWCEKVPELPRFAVPADVRIAESPAFEMRQPFWYDVKVHREFSAKLRVNGYNHTPNDVPEKLGGDDFRFGGGLPSCHTFYTLCDPKIYFKDHPEYFALVDGKRVGEGAQLCLTNPDVLEIVVSNVLARIRRDPGAKFYGVSQTDTECDKPGCCTCAACKAIDDEEESHAGTMVRFVNAVAARVEKEFPDVLIETLAYRYTRKPPKKARFRPNVVPCLCTIECEFARPIPESPFPQNVAFRDDIVGWKNQTDKLYVWDYVTQFAHYPNAFPNVYALQGNIRFFRDNGVKMLFEQGDYEGYHGGFAELKAWLLAKLMWNPDADLKALLDDFFAGYYGKAAPFVRDYFEDLHRRQLEISSDPTHPLGIYDRADLPPYNDEAFRTRADELWEKAEEAVAGTEPFAYNVRMGHFSHLYSRLEILRQRTSDDVLRNDPAAVALARRLLADKAAARGPLPLAEWNDKGRLAGWQTVAAGPSGFAR